MGSSTTSSGVEVLTTRNCSAMLIQLRMISRPHWLEIPGSRHPDPDQGNDGDDQAGFQPGEAAWCAAHGAALAPTNLPFVEPNICSMRSLSTSACVRRACGL